MPQTFEWTILWTIALAASILLGITAWPALAMLALGPVWALYYAWHAPLEKAHRRFTSRMLIAILAYTGPMCRTLTRYRMGLKMLGRKTSEIAPRQLPQVNLSRRELRLAYWNEQYVTRDVLLDRMMKLFARDGHPALVDRGWNDYDLELRLDPWTRVELKTADEEHEGMKLKNHIVARARLSRKSRIGLAAGLIGAGAAAFAVLPGFSLAILALTLAAGACAALALVRAGRYAYRAIEEAAAEINLIPLGTPTRAARLAERAASQSAAGRTARNRERGGFESARDRLSR